MQIMISMWQMLETESFYYDISYLIDFLEPAIGY